MTRHFVTVTDFSRKEIREVFDLADRLKKDLFSRNDALKGKVVGLIFEKPSNRTRVSFEVGAIHLGGSIVYLGPDDIHFGQREPVKDISRVLSRYLDMVVLRTYSHEDIKEYASFSDIPVINGLSDHAHPCQGLADCFTMKEKLGELAGKTLVYVGDCNNVLNSLLFSCLMLGMNVRIASPKKYWLAKDIIRDAKKLADANNARVEITDDPFTAVEGADCIYTDVWVSMGQEKERAARLKDFKKYQLNEKLLSKAGKGAYVMHCLPAHRGEEITDAVIEGGQSIVFDEAENRLHVQKAIMIKLMEWSN